MASEVVLEARGITKIYEGKEVVSAVNLDVTRADVKAIVGPSGSGKSTFLRCVALLEPADGGRICLDGRVVGESSSHLSWQRERNWRATERTSGWSSSASTSFRI